MNTFYKYDNNNIAATGTQSQTSINTNWVLETIPQSQNHQLKRVSTLLGTFLFFIIFIFSKSKIQKDKNKQTTQHYNIKKSCTISFDSILIFHVLCNFLLFISFH